MDSDESSDDVSEDKPLLISNDDKTHLLLMTETNTRYFIEEDGVGREDREDTDVAECVDIEDGFVLSGGCGSYQYYLQLIFSYLVICIASASFVPYFVLDDPPWQCTSNSTSHFCRNNTGKSISPENEFFNARCSMNRSEWTYVVDNKYSAVTEYDLVCGSSKLAELSNAMHYAGGVIGSILCGRGADYYGRKVVLILCLLVHILTSVGCAYVHEVWQLVALRGLNGASSLPCYNIAAVYLMEFVPTTHRAVSGLMYQGTYCISLFLLDGTGWLERHWRRFLIYITIPSILAFLSFLALLESPRWLLATGKVKKAENVMRKIAKRNGMTFDANLLSHNDDECRRVNVDNPMSKTDYEKTTSDSGSCSDEERTPSPKYRALKREHGETGDRESYSYVDLFRHRKVAFLTVSQSFLWLTTAMLYFAITLESSKLGGNMYKVFAYSVLVEIPGSFTALFFCNRIGRKKCILGSLLLCATFTGCISLVPRSMSNENNVIVSIAFALVAKFFVNLTFNAIYIWTFEINPTVIRSQGLNFCATLGYSGGIFSPYLVGTLQSVNRSLPFVTMALIAVLACAFGLILPETNNMPTRETYDDFFTADDGVESEGVTCDIEDDTT